jgi:hypothetical protein
VKLSARRDSERRITPARVDPHRRALFTPASASSRLSPLRCVPVVFLFLPARGWGRNPRGDYGEAGETPVSIPHCVHETHLRSFLHAGMPSDLSPPFPLAPAIFSVRVYMWLRDYSCFDGIFFQEPPVNDFCYSFI